MNTAEHTMIDADSLSALQLYEALSASFDSLRIPGNTEKHGQDRRPGSVFRIFRHRRKTEV